MMGRLPGPRTADRVAAAGTSGLDRDRIADQPVAPRRPARSRAWWLAKRVTCLLVLSVELVFYVCVLVMAEPGRLGLGAVLLLVLVCAVLVVLLWVELVLLQIGHEAMERLEASLEKS